jgi:maltooligosyltrehalose trehalohydrolase
MKAGVHYREDRAGEFVVWAPSLKRVELELVAPRSGIISMLRQERGYWSAVVENMVPGTRYLYRLEGRQRRPDPASHFQPEGVHGPSQVIDHRSFGWEDKTWKGMELSGMIIYEMHVGTFTPEGTFAAVIPRLDDLREAGINAIEIMPVSQFPGERNWGYDGVYPYAVQNSYGGPEGLKELVNACHLRGMAVILDVVYNHLGPEGNYLEAYGPYFSDTYRTPWGKAINFDGAHSNEVRSFFIENALHWFESYHVDALRLDAIHGILDMSARPFLQELAEQVSDYACNEARKIYLIAESDLNDVRVMRKRDEGGFGLDAQWCDDFHHSLHTILTGEQHGYYRDFGRIDHLATSLREGFVYSGQYSSYRRHNHGNSSAACPAEQFVVFSQNHDQVGNRMLGERLALLAPFEALKLAAAVVMLSPYVPLLFMGEEYGEESPFLYFVSHADPDLIAAVREGRKREFQAFRWQGQPPDPQQLDTFLRSQLAWDKRGEGAHKVLLTFYRQLITLRKNIPALAHLSKKRCEISASEEERIIIMRRWHEQNEAVCLFNFSDRHNQCRVTFAGTKWKKVLDSSDATWKGPGAVAPQTAEGSTQLSLQSLSAVLYEKERTA